MRKNGGLNITYSRLSKDDYQKKYVSIQNQKSITQKYALEHGITIDKEFEDDGVSGYTMDRPDFNELKHLIDENMVDVLIAKDLSRLGRHNANVLFFLERLQAHNVRLILVDENYDSATDSDDVIGIKTWYNERYVKEASRKVRNAMKIMQEKKELILRVPYGYEKDPYRKDKYYLDEDMAVWVRKIFEVYTSGCGYTKTAKIMNELGAPTRNTIINKRRKERGLHANFREAKGWDAKAIKDVIGNDFYIGTLRLRKTARNGINGAQRPIPEEELVFENAHEPIIDVALFNLAQELRDGRKNDKTFKGIRKYDNPYAGLLRCGDCGGSLTIGYYNNQEIISYRCRTYRDYGAKACTTHNINKKELNILIKDYLILCRTALKGMIESLDSILLEAVKRNDGHDIRLKALHKNIEIAQNELQTIMEQKIRDIAANPSMAEMIAKTYDTIQNDKMLLIENIMAQVKEYESIDQNKSDIKKNFKNALEIFDGIIASKEFTKRQLDTIIEKIYVYENNMIEIKLRGELQNIFDNQAIIRPSREDRLKRAAIEYMTSVSGFGLVKIMKAIRKTDSISYDNTLRLIEEFIDKGYVIQLAQRIQGRNNPPYMCVANKEEMLQGFKICTEVDIIRWYCKFSTDLENITKISMWISRYL